MQEIFSDAYAAKSKRSARRGFQRCGLALALLFAAASASAQGTGGEITLEKVAKSVHKAPSTGSAAPDRRRSGGYGDGGYGGGYGGRGGYGREDDLGDDLAADLVSDLGDAIIQVAADAVVQLGAMTLQRLDDSPNNPVRRDNGDILIPYLRYDFYRQSASPGVFALDNRVEAGIGPVAVMFEKYAFYDQRPNSGLILYRRMFLYRTSITRNFEFDIGGGETDISSPNMPGGTVGSFSLPLKYKFNDYMTMEFIPTWSGTLNDKELTLEAGKKFISAKVGYRYLTSTTGAILKGPFAGLVLRF